MEKKALACFTFSTHKVILKIKSQYTLKYATLLYNNFKNKYYVNLIDKICISLLYH